MMCPICGCPVDEPAHAFIATCTCCGAIWLVEADHRSLDRMLVGAEG